MLAAPLKQDARGEQFEKHERWGLSVQRVEKAGIIIELLIQAFLASTKNSWC